MNAAAMKKQINDIKTLEDNYVIFEFGYSAKVIVPFADAEKVISGLIRAEEYKAEYGKTRLITGLSQEFKFSLMAKNEYAKIKMETLLLEETSNADPEF